VAAKKAILALPGEWCSTGLPDFIQQSRKKKKAALKLKIIGKKVSHFLWF